METNDAIRQMVSTSGGTLSGVSLKMGKSANLLSASMQRPDCKASLLANAAEACDYKLALVPRRSLPRDAIVIDPPE